MILLGVHQTNKGLSARRSRLEGLEDAQRVHVARPAAEHVHAQAAARVGRVRRAQLRDQVRRVQACAPRGEAFNPQTLQGLLCRHVGPMPQPLHRVRGLAQAAVHALVLNGHRISPIRKRAAAPWRR